MGEPQMLTPPDLPKVPPCEIKLQPTSHGLTDVGKVRPGNEDQFLIARFTKRAEIEQCSLAASAEEYGTLDGHLFAVADGLGGYAGGELASAVAVSALKEFALNTLNWSDLLLRQPPDSAEDEFRQAFIQVEERLRRVRQERPEFADMATTLTMAYSLGTTLFVAHAGDTRAYLHRHGELWRLTQDHTLAAELLRRGAISEEEAAQGGLSHVVTNVIGREGAAVRADVRRLRLQPDDMVLLCSDGLTGMVPDEEIRGVLAATANPQEVCTRLVARANEAGGRDNITAIAIHYELAP